LKIINAGHIYLHSTLGFEPTISICEQENTFGTLDRTATVIGYRVVYERAVTLLLYILF
jgi:hypothetical protein